MGKLNIRFFFEGTEVGTIYTDEMKLAPMYYYKGHFNMKKMEEIEFEGENFNLDFDLNELKNTTNWEELKYPNEQVKGKVLEIVYYSEIKNVINKLLEKIHRCRFEDRYELGKLGQQAIEIINKTKPNLFLKNQNLFAGDTVGNIKYTLDKEVEMLNETKFTASKKRKQEVLDDAKKHLTDDIKRFSFHLDQFEVNDKN